MSDGFGISVPIGADDSGFQGVFNNVEKSLNSWGLDLDKLYSKGNSFFKGFGINIDQFAGKLGMGGPALAAIGTIAMTVGKQLFQLGLEFDEVNGTIAKSTGATGESLDKLNDTFKDLMQEGIEQTDLGDLSTAFSELSVKLDLTGDPLKEMTLRMADFADVTDQDVATAVKGATDVINKWGLSLDDVPDLLDQVTKAAQMSGQRAGDFMNTLKTSGAQLESFGLSITDSLSMLGAFGKAGVNSETVMRGLNTALAKFSKDGLEASSALEDVFARIQNAKDPTEATAIAMEVFGSRAGAEMAKALTTGGEGIETFRIALLNAKGTVEATDAASQTFGDKMAILTNRLKATFGPLGESVKNAAGLIVDMLSMIMEEVGPIITPIFNIVKITIGTVVDIVKELATAFKKMAVDSNVPLAALKAGIDTFYFWFKNNLGNILILVKDMIGFLSALMSGDWAKVWTYTKLIVLQVVKGILDSLSGMANTVISIVNTMIGALNNVLKPFGKEIHEIAALTLAESLGINAEIKKLTAELQKDTSTKSMEIGKAVKAQSTAVVEASKDAAEAEAKYSKAAKEEYLKNLGIEKSAAIQAGKDKQVPLADLLEVSKSYNAKELASYKILMEMERAASLAEAKLKGADQKTIADINLLYDQKIIGYTRAQIVEETKLEKDYSATLASEDAKRAKAEIAEAKRVQEEKEKQDIAILAEAERAMAEETAIAVEGADAEIAERKRYEAIFLEAEARATDEKRKEEEERLAHAELMAARESQLAVDGADAEIYEQELLTERKAEEEAIQLANAEASSRAEYEAAETSAAIELESIRKVQEADEAALAYAESMAAEEQRLALETANVMLAASKVPLEGIEKVFADMGDAWDETIDSIVKKSSDWSGVVNGLTNAVGDSLVGGLEIVGESIVTGKADWQAWGNSALTALAGILESLGYQLAALSLTHLLMWDFVGSALAAAGSIAAFVGSGVIKGLVKESEAATKAAEDAAKAATETAEKQAEAATKAAEKLIKYTTALEDQNTELKFAKNLFQDLTRATEAYNSVLVKIKSSALSFYESLQNIGADIASKLVANFVGGLAEADFLTEMKKYITNLVIQTAIYTDSLTAKIALIGTRLATAIATGMSAADMEAIKAELVKVYSTASTTALAASSLVNEAFSGYAAGTNYSSAGVHMVGEYGPELVRLPQGSQVTNTTNTKNVAGGKTVTFAPVFNSPRAMNQYEQRRAMRQQMREAAFQGVFQ